MQYEFVSKLLYKHLNCVLTQTNICCVCLRKFNTFGSMMLFCKEYFWYSFLSQEMYVF